MSVRAEIPEAFDYLFEPSRYKVAWGGRGGAKSWNYARALLILAAQNKMLVLCARELQNSIKESVHLLLSQQIDALGLGGFYEILNNEIRGANGSRFIFEGIKHNTDKIKSMESVDVCWVEEADKVSDASWQILIPTIRKAGSEIWATFNPKNKHDAVYQRFILYPPSNAIVRKVSWRDNPWFTEEMRVEMEHLKAVDYEKYMHVWEGELQTIADGAIYGKEILAARRDNRILDFPIETGVQCYSFWDLGRNDSTAIWVMQEVGGWYNFIDYYENRLVGLEDYIRWTRSLPYIWGEHYLPHDVEILVLGMNRSRRQQLEDAGIQPIVTVDRISDINHGIDMARAAFGKCRFHATNCERGIDALSNYQYTYDESNDTYRRHPAHTWASHGADAFRQFAQGYRGTQSGWAQYRQQNMSSRRAKKLKGNPWGDSDTSWVV